MPLDFSDQAYERLKRHKYPFAGALKQVGAGLSRPRPEDPFYIRVNASNRDVRTRRFDTIRTKLGERLHQWVAAKQADKLGAGGSMSSEIVPTVQCFQGCEGTGEAIARGGGHGTH